MKTEIINIVTSFSPPCYKLVTNLFIVHKLVTAKKINLFIKNKITKTHTYGTGHMQRRTCRQAPASTRLKWVSHHKTLLECVLTRACVLLSLRVHLRIEL